MALFFHQFRLLLLLTVCTAAAIASCWPWEQQKKIDFELTGQVLDIGTKQPLEGAFVIAIYKEVKSGFAATANYCVKTRGMYTGKDGKFHFPVEKLDGNSPYWVSAIKPDYYYVISEVAPPKIHREQGIAAYSGRNVYLARQDLANPKISGDGDDILCRRAASKDDIAASIEFLKISLAETEKYAGPLKQQIKETTQSMIQSLEAVPPRMPVVPK